MTVPRILSWLVADDPAPQDFHRWDLSEHPDDTQQTHATDKDKDR